MFLFGQVLRGWAIALVAVACTALAETYDGFPLTLYSGFPRLILYFAAFVTTGFFVREIQRNRRQTLIHLQKIEAQRDALSQTEQQLKSLIESSPAAIVTTDSEGVILLANEAAHRLFGTLDKTLDGIKIARYVPSLAKLGPGRCSDPTFRAVMQARGFREDGDAFLADICFSTYPTSFGVRLTAMILDVSDDMREHEESSLHQLMTGSRIAVGAMSHEIRNICAAISVVHQNLSRSGLLNTNQDFGSLGALIDTLENVAAIELGQATTACTEVELAAVLDDLRIVVAPSFQEKEIETTWIIDEDLPPVWADRSQLLQIFLNLANNSLRVLSDRGAGEFQVIAKAEPDRVVVEFRDNGGGVKEPATLFRPFQEGAIATGLGLYLSRAFARSFGGDLRYYPIPGHASFVIELVPATMAKAV